MTYDVDYDEMRDELREAAGFEESIEREESCD